MNLHRDEIFHESLSLANSNLQIRFIRCTFEGEVDFSGSTFTGESTMFIECTFKGYTSFGGCRFSARTTLFSKCAFKGQTIFNKAVFEDTTIFEGSRDSLGGLVFEGETGFKYVTIRKAREFQFKHVTFEKVELRGTDLSELRFVAVHWPHKRSKFSFRDNIVLYDQLLLEREGTNAPPQEFDLLQTAYRELKQNYDNNRFFGPADDFYFREMEMLRCYPGSLRTRYLSWRFLYRRVSGYGLYWLNGLLSLTFTILIFSALILFTGLDKPQIDYDLARSFPSLLRLFFDYVEVLKYNLLSTLPSKEISALYSPSICTRLILIPEYILIAAFSTLTVLAIRRRFKR
ncbi:MAG TPA: hypothetical protein DGH68_08150 [Bacteroidetes bacterium]|jgi:hypothetical protein|nr:hypothetical protein [Bacteroidota bacterium]